MDRSWLHKPLVSVEYREGIRSFLNFVRGNFPNKETVHCPCSRCCNTSWRTLAEVEEHLVCRGFVKDYDVWYCHGESLSSSSFGLPYDPYLSHLDPESPPQTQPSNQENQNDGDDIEGLIRDHFGFHGFNFENQDADENPGAESAMPSESDSKEAKTFQKLMEEAKTPLYDDCKSFSRLAFIVRLFHLKCMNGWSNKSFTMLLQLLSEAFPKSTKLPSNAYSTKQFLKAFDLGYEKIHACRNDCMLYRGEYEQQTKCHVCGEDRYIIKECTRVDDEGDLVSKKKPAKVLRYFPLIPRLKRLFMSSKTSSYMKWHAEYKKKEGLMKHPSDSEAWKSFDQQHPTFASESRNIKIGIAADGVSPYKNLSTTHSTWPVILIPYNLPPWIGMKQSSFILSMIIPGPKGPGSDIDVYLQPLIDELIQLWEGVDTYDASNGETFKMRAALFWTINDFPAYDNLCGRSTKGRFACPVCGDDTCSKWLTNGHKFCYQGHRRWLDIDDSRRSKPHLFDGTTDYRLAPKALSGSEVLEQTEGLNYCYGKGQTQRAKRAGKKRAREEDATEADHGEGATWKRRCIFFKLPYWHTLLIRHNIDVMHTEKNVGVNFTATMLGVDGVSKDNMNARLDLVEMGIRSVLHPFHDEKGKLKCKPAAYTMNHKDKELFCKVLKNLKLPDGYASNISSSVNDKDYKLQGMKSHDYHILMQDLLPVALRRSLPKHVVKVVREVCSIFKGVCGKVLDVNQLQELQSRAVQALCQLETIFPPSFFTIMVHLVIHLAEEARIAGPVHYRWMYPIERFLLKLKNYVRNRAHPEGSMAECYLAEECAIFCSRYLEGIETRFNRESRNEDDLEDGAENYLFSSGGRKMGKVEYFQLEEVTWVQAHRYVLFQHKDIQPFVEKFLNEVKARYRPRRYREHQLDKIKNEKFHEWFANYAQNSNDGELSSELMTLAAGPLRVAARFKSFIFNGKRFHTKDRERNLKTQNSGLLLRSEVGSYSSSKDNNPVIGEVDYYGVLTDMIELDYGCKYKVVLFRGDWVNVLEKDKAVKVDPLGFTIVNLNELLYKGADNVSHEPFAISSQVQQVYYVQDPIDENWHVVLKATPRDVYEEEDDEEEDDVYEGDVEGNVTPLRPQEFEEVSTWERTNNEGETLDALFL